MSTIVTTEAFASSPSLAQISPAYVEPRWYAIYTMPRHERVIAEQLTTKSLDCYLPLHAKISRWKDRQVSLDWPLFPGYVFVRFPYRQRVAVLETAGVIRIVSFSGRPAEIAEAEIDMLRKYVATRKAEPYPYLAVGKRVRIASGPWQGLEGIVQRRKGKMRLVLSIDSIARSVAVELAACDVQPI